MPTRTVNELLLNYLTDRFYGEWIRLYIILIAKAISLLTFEIVDGSKVVFTIGLIALIARTVIHLDLRRTHVTFTQDGQSG